MMYWLSVILASLAFIVGSWRHRQIWWAPPLFVLMACILGFVNGAIFQKNRKSKVTEDRYIRS